MLHVTLFLLQTMELCFDMLDYELSQMGTSNSKFLVARRVTLVVAFGFPQNFGKVAGMYKRYFDSL